MKAQLATILRSPLVGEGASKGRMRGLQYREGREIGAPPRAVSPSSVSRRARATFSHEGRREEGA